MHGFTYFSFVDFATVTIVSRFAIIPKTQRKQIIDAYIATSRSLKGRINTKPLQEQAYVNSDI